MPNPVRRASIIGVLIGLALVLGSCSDDDDPAAVPDPAEAAAQELESTESSSADAVTTTSDPEAIISPTEMPGAVINKFNLEVGDCFDVVEVLTDGRPESRTTQLDCEEPHHFEIYHRFIYPAEHPAVFPGDSAMRDYAFEVCYREFATWVDEEYEVSTLEIGVITPDRQDFESNASRYRGIHCWVERFDGEPMVGTSRGSGW